MLTEEEENKQVCFTLFSKFIKEVVIRAQQYKDELLAACLNLVLAVPKQFVNIPMLLPALKTALKMGLRFVHTNSWFPNSRYPILISHLVISRLVILP